MTNLTTYPLIDGFETTLAQSWNGATGTVYLNTAPSFTFPSGVKTYIVVNPGKTTMQVGRIDSMNTGNKTVNVDSITIEKGASVNYSAQTHAVGSKVIISDNYQFWKDLATAINSKADSASPVFTGSVTVPEYVDATARDAAIPTPTDGMIVQTGGIYQGYNAGTAQWESFDIGTPPPDASTTVKGLVQEATDAQVGASTATGSTGAKLFINPTSVVKTSSGAADENKLVALNAQGQVAAGFINNAAVLAEGVEALVDKDTYFLGEDADAGDSVFVEDMVTFALATSVQNIGDVTANTRVSIPVIGSGVAATTLKLSLKKFVSPGVDLGVRIETDNSGEPSGTLADANATATVLTSGLTTSLVDTTVTLAGSITLTEGTKYHIVLFAGTYGAETINGTNYFGVGYSTNNTTTRPTNTYDGSVRGTADNDKFVYATSDLFLPKLLSKTNATYSYKLPTDVPRIATESKSAGEHCIATTLGYNSNQTGLTALTDYYLSDTPGAISATPGTNNYRIGYGVSSTILNIKPRDVGYGNSYVITSSNAEVTTLSTSLVKVKEILCNRSFQFNVYFEIKINSNPSICTGRIYVNGVAVGTSRTNNTSVYTGFEEYITVSKGDLIQIYMSTNNGAQTASLQNFRLRGSLIQPQGMNNVVNI